MNYPEQDISFDRLEMLLADWPVDGRVIVGLNKTINIPAQLLKRKLYASINIQSSSDPRRLELGLQLLSRGTVTGEIPIELAFSTATVQRAAISAINTTTNVPNLIAYASYEVGGAINSSLAPYEVVCTADQLRLYVKNSIGVWSLPRIFILCVSERYRGGKNGQ